MSQRTFYFALISLILASLALDQWTKIHSEQHHLVWEDPSNHRQYRGKRTEVISVGEYSQNPKARYLVFSLNYVRNPGAAWGALASLPETMRRPFFYVVTLFALVALGVFFNQTPKRKHAVQVALALIFSGAIGNLIDRIRLGYVIDWVDIRWNVLGIRYNFPNFNVADIVITIGVVIVIVDILFFDQKSDDTPPT